MARFEDLSPCDYFPFPSENLIAVGWLELDSKYERGSVDSDFYIKLKALCTDPWQPISAAGSHSCELCQFEAPRFMQNIFVPYDGSIYVAPVAVLHYITAHWYRPPEVFINAVMACPAMNSTEYKKALLANGGRHLVGPLNN
jgi:hypothetical protein